LKTGVVLNLIAEGYVRRRDFIKVVIGSATVWPLPARAQEPGKPVIGFLNAASARGYERQLAAFLKGLAEMGFVDGQNVTIEYRWADGQHDRLPTMAAELVRRQVTVIAATTTPAALAARLATTTIPIVFEGGNDPIRVGLVARLDRPGGNITGVTQLNVQVGSKRLELLHEAIGKATVIAYLVNPNDNIEIADMQEAARNLGVELRVVNATTEREFDAAFANVVQMRAGGLVIGSSSFFVARLKELAALAVRHGVPAIFEDREFAAAGGLMSYGGSITEGYRMTGVYVGRILKGERASELPVQQGTKVELRINLNAARALGLNIPNSLIGRADEVIE
jgi:putative tryptophan/tyrosine transport system substrate-binding protein